MMVMLNRSATPGRKPRAFKVSAISASVWLSSKRSISATTDGLVLRNSGAESGKGSRIVNSYVGPFTSIHHGVEIRNSELEHSIVLENSKILDVSVRIEDSLIGKDVVVRRTTKMPKALRFMLGDHAEVELAT